jgi:hypothetical protein
VIENPECIASVHVKKCIPSYGSVYLIVLVFLFYVSAASAQNEGIGTFSDLVGQALQVSAQPQPTPVVTESLRMNFATGEKETVFAEKAPPLFSAPVIGFEYDYRRNQQKAPDGLTIDVNEAHSSFSFRLSSTNLAFEYVHIWLEGSNDVGGKQSIDSNGVKATLTQPIGNYLIFSLPLFYKNGDGDAVTSTGPQTFGMDTFVMYPFMVVSVPLAIMKDSHGQPEPAKQQPLTLSMSPGYRLGITEQNNIHPVSPDVDGWTGTFSLLVGAEYGPKDKDGYSEWNISGNATWSHLTNFYSSKPSLRPDDNGFALAATFVFNFCPFDSNGTKQPRWTAKVGYQYDGFNRDQYQHSVTVGGTYRFW